MFATAQAYVIWNITLTLRDPLFIGSSLVFGSQVQNVRNQERSHKFSKKIIISRGIWWSVFIDIQRAFIACNKKMIKSIFEDGRKPLPRAVISAAPQDKFTTCRSRVTKCQRSRVVFTPFYCFISVRSIWQAAVWANLCGNCVSETIYLARMSSGSKISIFTQKIVLFQRCASLRLAVLLKKNLTLIELMNDRKIQNSLRISNFFELIFFFHVLFLPISVQFLAVIEANVTSDDVTETQHTTCKIATEDVVANARATVTTVLSGACKASEWKNKL